MNETIFVHEIGEVNIIYSQTANRIRISVKPFKGVILTIPSYAKKEQALAFLDQKRDWLKKSLSKIEKVEDRNTVFEEHTDFKTRNHSLKLIKLKVKNISLSVSGNLILVRVPETLNIRDEQVQSAARKGIEFALRKEALAYLPQRLDELAKMHGLKYKSVSIRPSKTRWGSCSSANSINFSLHLMRLPDRLIDYVILHELAHIVEKNHSSRFWNYLETICPRSQQLDKELSRYSTIYY